jgi:radical SAM superfamily enzyme YgiQ (UPF0313 family)
MPDLVLATLNARWTHASLGLRCLMANLGPLASRARLREFEIGGVPTEIAAEIMRESPRVVGFGVYVWNVRETTEVAGILKRLAPELRLVIGGPEVSYEADDLPLVRLADHVIHGEADLAFRDLCAALLAPDADQSPRPPKTIDAPPPDLAALALPYDLYDEVDVSRRTLYVEASRGCPYSCEFCLSALDVPVRRAPLAEFLAALGRLYDRGARRFKFVDRTFNLDLRTAEAILRFFLARLSPELFLHFEMVPDRFPAELRAVVAEFPPGTLQFEVGVQTLDDDVSARIARRQDVAKLEDNLRFLRKAGVHVHADLIMGLPGEDEATFAAGFDRLYALEPDEIQVGVLKRLRGAPLARHDATMVYAPDPPYEVLRSDVLDFETLLRMKRFAKAWDLIANRGNFAETLPALLADGSAYARFAALSESVFAAAGRDAGRHGIALGKLLELVFEHAVGERGLGAAAIAETLLRDYRRGGRNDVPPVLRPHLPADAAATGRGPASAAIRPGLERQDRRR